LVEAGLRRICQPPNGQYVEGTVNWGRGRWRNNRSQMFGRSDALHLSQDERELEMLAENGWLDWLMAA
jgi:hypothetical protein